MVALPVILATAAVVGGHRVPPSGVPWFATLSGCGATLVAPDRLLTAGHCVRGAAPEDLGRIGVGGVVRRAVRFAMAPGWRRRNAGNVLDDVALVQLDASVPGAAPVGLSSGPLPRRARVVGRGLSMAPPRGQAPGIGDHALREASLRVVADRACARRYARRRGNSGERFSAARMVCAADADGRAPLSSACVGDSGGPLYAGSRAAPVLVGVVSWGGARCGADRLPSVFAEVARYRAFITAAAPVWAPVARGPAAISGAARAGGRVSCAVPGWDGAPSRVDVLWQRLAERRVTTVGRSAEYAVQPADTGQLLVCGISASNAGGLASAAPASVRVAR